MYRRRILLIEDSPTYRKLASLLLTASGHAITCADTAEGGLRVAREEVPDLILMDMHLPDSDGLAAVRRLRQDPRSRGTFTIPITAGLILGEDRQAARDAGFDAYSEKPFSEAEFRSLIEPYVDPLGGSGATTEGS